MCVPSQHRLVSWLSLNLNFITIQILMDMPIFFFRGFSDNLNAFTITSQCHIPQGFQVSNIPRYATSSCCVLVYTCQFNTKFQNFKRIEILYPVSSFRCMILMARNAIIASCLIMAFQWRTMLTWLDFVQMRYTLVGNSTFLTNFRWCCACPKKYYIMFCYIHSSIIHYHPASLSH